MFTRRVDPVMAGLAAFSVAIVFWFLLGPGGATTSWAVQTCLDLLTAAAAWRLVQATADDRHARRFWGAVVTAAGLSATGDGFQTSLAVLHLADHQPSPVQTWLVVLGMVVVVIGMLLHPLGGSGRRRLRLWLDAATVLTAVAVYLWYCVLADVVAGTDTPWIGAVATSAVMLLITVGLLKLMLSGTAPFARGPGIVASIGVAGTAIAASTVALLTGGEDPGLIFVAQLGPCLLMPVSMRYQILRMRRTHTGPAVSTRRSSRLPYLAVGSVQLLLIAALLDNGDRLKMWGVAVGAMAITALVLSRQVTAFTDNEQLLVEIDNSMAEVHSQREWFRSLVQHSSDMTLVVGTDGMVRFTTPAVHRLLGIDDEAVQGSVLADRVHPEDQPAIRELMRSLAANPGAEADVQARVLHTNGTYRWLQVIAVDLTANPSVNALVFNARDITEARALHDELRHQATHDALTGLANRTLFEERLTRIAVTDEVSVLLIDLDEFKPINDQYGHHAGDQVLIAVADRLTTWVGEAGLAVRMGGDEFAVLLPGVGEAEAQQWAEHIVLAIGEPISLVAEQQVTVGSSVGVASGQPHHAGRLLRDADAAMYRMKAQRKADCQLAGPTVSRPVPVNSSQAGAAAG